MKEHLQTKTVLMFNERTLSETVLMFNERTHTNLTNGALII